MKQQELGGWPQPVRLQGAHVSLAPLSLEHAADLAVAVRDGELWTLRYTSVPAPEQMEQEITKRLARHAQGAMTPFAVLDPQGRAVGMTSFASIDAENRRVEIGWTWYARSVQRTALNTECKLLLLRHAFEVLDCIAVEFRTSRLNLQSQRAIERLGARLDGVMRNHMRHADGTLRDTCVYSVIASEWPAVRSHLLWLLEQWSRRA